MFEVKIPVTLPASLVQEIDALVGKNGRNAFLVEVAQKEIQRRGPDVTVLSEDDKTISRCQVSVYRRAHEFLGPQ